MDNREATEHLTILLDRLLEAGWYCLFTSEAEHWSCTLARGEQMLGMARATVMNEALLLAFRRACIYAEHTRVES